MAGAGQADPAALAAELVEVRERLARLEAAMGLGSPERAQDGQDKQPARYHTLQRAAGAWGVSDEAARKRALRLVDLGLAERCRPGGWRISDEGIKLYSRS